jgi:hypothetical protein
VVVARSDEDGTVAPLSTVARVGKGRGSRAGESPRSPVLRVRECALCANQMWRSSLPRRIGQVVPFAAGHSARRGWTYSQVRKEKRTPLNRRFPPDPRAPRLPDGVVSARAVARRVGRARWRVSLAAFEPGR